MSYEQIVLFSLFAGVFIFLLASSVRYDLVALAALILGGLLGAVPSEILFSGFGHPATIIVALVLIISKGLINSGAVHHITRFLTNPREAIGSHITRMSVAGGFLSAFMNNVAALALLMPVEISASKKQKRGSGHTLMPLAFATILGGMITLIGTPPNIIIASIRERHMGESFKMFDFAPVGLSAAIIGTLFVAFIGWRLLPKARGETNALESLFEVDAYIAELVVKGQSKSIGKRVSDLDDDFLDANATIIGLVRKGRRLPGAARSAEICEGDHLIVEANLEAIDVLMGRLGLSFEGQEREVKASSSDMTLSEVVVTKESRIAWRSAFQIRLLARQGITLLGISRKGKRFDDRVRKQIIQPGDILLLLGPLDRVNDVVRWLDCLPLAERGLDLTRHHMAGIAALIFGGMIVLASFGLIDLPLALGCVVVLYVLLDIVPIRQLYDEVEWPVIVLLGSMIPLGLALEQAGGTALIGGWIAYLTQGYSAAMALTLLLILTMTLSDILNNTATAVVAAPVGIDLAERLGVSADPFLMAVAVGASCAFLTPIGHKNNTLVMGPGGYAFGDYWRMGLPLEIIVVIVSVPAILIFWPL